MSEKLLIYYLGHPFLVPKRKNIDDEWITIQPRSMDDIFLNVLQELEYPPVEGDRLNIKLRFFSKSTTEVSSGFGLLSLRL